MQLTNKTCSLLSDTQLSWFQVPKSHAILKKVKRFKSLTNFQKCSQTLNFKILLGFSEAQLISGTYKFHNISIRFKNLLLLGILQNPENFVERTSNVFTITWKTPKSIRHVHIFSTISTQIMKQSTCLLLSSSNYRKMDL